VTSGGGKDRGRLEREFRRVQTMAGIGCWELDLSDRKDINRNALTWSDGLYLIFGYEPGSVEVSNELFFNAVHPADRDAIAKAVAEALRDRKPYSIEHRIIRKDGEVRHVREHADLIFDEQGRITAMFGTAQDITERKQAQLELKALNAELDARVQARTADLEAALADLETFSYTASHDLRAPLRALQGWSEALSKELAGKVPRSAETTLRRIGDSARRMDRLIQDLLALSHATKSELPLADVDLDALVAELREHYPQWTGAGIAVARPLRRVRGSEPLLAQALANLVNNALKFTKPGRAPKVSISTETEGGKVRLTVADEGLGIDPAYHERVFRPFVRLHPTDRYEGSGIGLAIVKKAVERMGGRVGVDSEPGRGSRFWIELPGA
jgi:PAS domain S-box-containing protein